jgi:tRNA nucleotidyltransferase/poly(A) polymerase
LNPNITIGDDPLRLFRALRFTITKNLTMDPSLWVAFKNPLIYQKLWTVVSSERIREELTKMFAFDTSASLKLLFDFGKEIESVYPTFLSDLFEKTGIWLKPTTEKPK